MLNLTIAGYRRGNVFAIGSDEFDTLITTLTPTDYRVFRFVHANFAVEQVLYPLYAEYGIDVLLLDSCSLGNLEELAELFNAVVITTHKVALSKQVVNEPQIQPMLDDYLEQARQRGKREGTISIEEVRQRLGIHVK